MTIRARPIGLFLTALLGAFLGCSSASRAPRPPSVAIVISPGLNNRPLPADVAEIHRLLQPEIERRGYVMAKSSRSADYFVYVRYPIDPLTLRRLPFVRAEPTVPFLSDTESEADRRRRENKRAIADMVADPK